MFPSQRSLSIICKRCRCHTDLNYTKDIADERQQFAHKISLEKLTMCEKIHSWDPRHSLNASLQCMKINLFPESASTLLLNLQVATHGKKYCVLRRQFRWVSWTKLSGVYCLATIPFTFCHDLIQRRKSKLLYIYKCLHA